MKVGVLQFFSWPQRRVPLETVYERALQRIAIMDQTGYDAIWLAEHHFNTYSVCPSVHIMATHVAAQTKNLRIGTAVSVAALYHPLRLAEEVALLDVLTGGRVNWGAGRGYDQVEFRAFNVPFAESRERLFEAVDIVLHAWTEDRLTYHGTFYDFEDIEVLPKPRQKPHPPTWVGVSSPDSIELAASRGYSIMLGPQRPHAEVREHRALYAKTLAAHGFSMNGREVPTARLLAVGATEAEGEEIARRGASWTLTYARTQAGADDPVKRYMDDIIVYGSPDSVLDKLLKLNAEIPLDYLLCAPLSHSSFTLFTEKVLPRLLDQA